MSEEEIIAQALDFIEEKLASFFNLKKMTTFTTHLTHPTNQMK
jgi:hypothetical protein